MPYLEKYNSDDIHARSIIAGLLHYLNQELFILNTWNKDEKEQEIVEIPFYYSMTGDERYLQDFFAMQANSCYKAGLEGNFDAKPRGIVKLDSNTIDTSAQGARMIRGTFNRVIKKFQNEDGEMYISGESLEAFNGYINILPMRFNFSVEMVLNTITEAFKIQQTIIETFYISKTFFTTYKGILVECAVNFPQDYGIEKQFEFAYPSDTEIKLSFNLELATYLPVIDEPNLGNNNAIANVNSMNEWLNEGQKYLNVAPTNSKDTVEYTGLYGREIKGNENSYFIGTSRRDILKTRLGHNALYDGNECGTMEDARLVKDNYSYETSSIRKNSNRIERFLFTEFSTDNDAKRIVLDGPASVKPGKDVELSWTTTGYLHKIDLYFYKKKENGEPYGLTQIVKYLPTHPSNYEWHVPSDLTVENTTAKIAINSSSGKGKDASAFAVIDDGGMIVDVIIENPGRFYDESVVFEVEMDGEQATLVPVVQNGEIVDCEIRSYGNYEVDSAANEDKTIYVVAVGSAGNVKSNELQISLV